MGNANITTALIIILCVDAILFLGQTAITKINPGSAPQFLNFQGSLISRADVGNYTIDQSINGTKLPAGEGSISPTTGNIFVDGFTALKNWFLESSGIGYLFAILGGPVTYLSYLNAPQEFIFSVGAIWYLMTLFLIVAFFVGRTS